MKTRINFVLLILLFGFQSMLFSISNLEIDNFISEYILSMSKVAVILENVQPTNYATRLVFARYGASTTVTNVVTVVQTTKRGYHLYFGDNPETSWWFNLTTKHTKYTKIIEERKRSIELKNKDYIHKKRFKIEIHKKRDIA